MRIRRISLFLCVIVPVSYALNNGVALTPPMGWLSWQRFGCNIDCVNYPDTCISENLYMKQAHELVVGGYRDAGYRYVNIDDCWSEMERDADGNVNENRTRFPNGLRYMSRELHKLGLLFGLYTDIGTKTCAGYPGLEGHYQQDAKKFALEYEIDSLKVDGCYSQRKTLNASYPAFGGYLNETGRRILYNCQWPLYDANSNYGEDPDVLNPFVKHHCNQWRNYWDIADNWVSVHNIINHWTRENASDPLVRAGGPGHWNDPDMLVVGNPGLSISEQQAQFCLWAIFASPLLISTDLRTIPADSRDILLNKEVIAVNQDVMGHQGWCAQGANTDLRVYVRELLPSNGKSCCKGHSDVWAVVLANFKGSFNEERLTFDPKLHLPDGNHGNRWDSFEVRDILLHQDIEGVFNTFSVGVDESSVKMFKVKLHKAQNLPPKNPSLRSVVPE